MLRPARACAVEPLSAESKQNLLVGEMRGVSRAVPVGDRAVCGGLRPLCPWVSRAVPACGGGRRPGPSVPQPAGAGRITKLRPEFVPLARQVLVFLPKRSIFAAGVWVRWIKIAGGCVTVTRLHQASWTTKAARTIIRMRPTVHCLTNDVSAQAMLQVTWPSECPFGVV